LLEAALLRVPDEQWRDAAPVEYEVDADGCIVTGDPIVDAWERRLQHG